MLELFFGSTLIGGQYQFTNKSMIQEGAEFMAAMGGNQYKFRFPTLDCKNENRTLSEILDTEEMRNTIGNQGIKTYTLWISSCSKDTAKDYYDFSVKLMKRYNGTGKTFYLGAWEQDWWAREPVERYDENLPLDPIKLKFVINDGNTKQASIDKAREAISSDVKLHAYVEANRVVRAMRNSSYSSISNLVLPIIDVDYVSYSSYDSTGDGKPEKNMDLFVQALDFLQSKLKPRQGLDQDSRIILGEYAIPNPLNNAAGDMEQRDHAISVVARAVAWGVKDTYFWEIYNNEIPLGKHRGFWLRKPDGTYTPLYNDIKAYFEKLGEWYSQKQIITYGENRRKAVELLCQLLGNPNCAKWRDIERDSKIFVMSCQCVPQSVDGQQYVQWIGNWFGDCIYTFMDKSSFSLGLLSLLCSMISMLPQIYKNYKNQSVRGLSLGLVVFWTLGDVSNYIGTLTTNQLSTQKLTAFCFVLSDLIIVFQYIIYCRNIEYSHLAGEDEDVVVGGEVTSPSIASTIIIAASGVEALKLCNARPEIGPGMHMVGVFMAWASGSFYFCSRIPQIIENHRLQSVKGLSGTLVALTVIANITYGLSILLRKPVLDKAFFEATFPYLLGSLGTLLFDCITLIQASMYGGF